ncbi:PREDICTED: laccase-6 [Tarenaya hassleriana]|uniref:laccase-6 n=1 Tax=Tarenaya hassleriana TaxID=28532 RepID=UPI00053C5F76|nr:PREDICTED: laccase-6 [Tarenaya hassleriana]
MKMTNPAIPSFLHLIPLLFLLHVMTVAGRSSATRFYHFKVQTMRLTRLCQTNEIVTINGKFPGPAIRAQEDDRVIVTVTNRTPYNTTIHWHGVKQKLSCWYDGPSYITQCPIQSGQSFTYNFTLTQQKGTFFWHAHVSWLRATVYGSLVVYPKAGVPYPFKKPFMENTIILGEYWLKDVVQLQQHVLESGGPPPPADAFTINGQPGPNYNCSSNDVYEIKIVPGKTYLLRLINAGINMESFFTIANHRFTIVEADGEYTKPLTTERVMLVPGQTMNVLVTADQAIGKYSIAMGPYESGKNIKFQNTSAIAYLQYLGALPNTLTLPAKLPDFNDNLAAKNVMDGLRSLNTVDVPKDIEANLFITIGINVNKCNSENPKDKCQGPKNGRLAASMNNISFVEPKVSILEAYYKKLDGYFTTDFPGVPEKFSDFVNGAPNNIPNDTQAANGTRAIVFEYGTKIQLIFQNTGTLTTENHPIHIHGHSFYVIGYGTGNYDQRTAQFNLEDPPYMNTIGVPVGGWAAIRFVADNPGVWFLHCHIDIHQSWGLSTMFIVKNGKKELESLPQPPADLPKC